MAFYASLGAPWFSPLKGRFWAPICTTCRTAVGRYCHFARVLMQPFGRDGRSVVAGLSRTTADVTSDLLDHADEGQVPK